MFIAVTALK